MALYKFLHQGFIVLMQELWSQRVYFVGFNQINFGKKRMDKPEIKKFLTKIVAINTSNPPGNESEAADFLAGFLKNKARKIELIGRDKRKNIIAFFGNLKSENILLFNGHLDAVPFDKNEWQTNPLELVGGVNIIMAAARLI